MFRYFSMAGMVAVTLACGSAFPAGSAPSADAAAKTVKEDLDRYKANGFVMEQVKDAPTARAFPKHFFFGVYFRQYPVARLTPEGMNNSNLYVVGPEGKAQLLKEALQLQSFFRKTLAPAKDDAAAKDAARAYVRLMEELHQDGFYKFALQDDSTKVEPTNGGKKATARAVVMAGGNGELGATLTIDQAGQVSTITENVKLRAGPRPICQASKLLDNDPIVRRMAEQDLRIMGRAARYYFEEQRIKAAPELRRAIDRIWELIVEDR